MIEAGVCRHDTCIAMAGPLPTPSDTASNASSGTNGMPGSRLAIQRETSMKRWYCAWKTRTIMARNPDWGDLYQKMI
ncbi:hypothetical protein [Bosea sp. LC85]|uniref:hypothetical protein n=1 Tax=Bosea sp. LC85 TaxID=1502851 RepID=UPI001AEBE064|nr:hypothetical protein [Bosea sp. LC85]